MARRTVFLLATLVVAFLAASPADAENARSTACVGRDYSYAGVQSENTAHGVAATLAPISAPAVTDGHVGGWIGVGGPSAGPNGAPEWLQVGFSAFTADETSHMYYEATVPGSTPTYHELASNVQPGEKHRFSVLEMAGRKSWWRVWVDGKPVSPPIHMPGSHGAWYPQAVAENWNGGTGTCNGFAYSFENVALATKSGGTWRPLKATSLFQDPGYKVVKSARVAGTFVATSL